MSQRPKQIDIKIRRKGYGEGRLGVPGNRGTCQIYPGNNGLWQKLKSNKGTSPCPEIRERGFPLNIAQGFL